MKSTFISLRSFIAPMSATRFLSFSVLTICALSCLVAAFYALNQVPDIYSASTVFSIGALAAFSMAITAFIISDCDIEKAALLAGGVIACTGLLVLIGLIAFNIVAGF